jgi:predicted metal-dependent hydrolase
MKTSIGQSIILEGRRVRYRLVESNGARKLRVRIGPQGVEVIRPRTRSPKDAKEFLLNNQKWIVDQLHRIEDFSFVKRPPSKPPKELLFHGKPMRVDVVKPSIGGPNKVLWTAEGLAIVRGRSSKTHPAKSLEYWLRRQARQEITFQLSLMTSKLKGAPHRVFVMDQRTKWGNCSAKRNLSFNWRLILAPDFVLRYIVAHEATHLRVSDHSPRFWLTVQSLCPEAARAKQWLRTNRKMLMGDLKQICGSV